MSMYNFMSFILLYVCKVSQLTRSPGITSKVRVV